MKIALVVGINHYKHGGDLFGCVNDAYNVKTILSRHSDGSVNFDCKLLVANSDKDSIDRGELKDAVENYYQLRQRLHYSICRAWTYRSIWGIFVSF